jgi:hypothetical protein
MDCSLTVHRPGAVSLTPEAQFLASTVAAYLADRPLHLPGKVGATLVQAARREGLAGVLTRGLGNTPEGLAGSLLEASRLRCFGGAVRTLELLPEIAAVVEAQGTRATLLKGGALLTTVYRSALDVRPLSDLDLLAPTDQMPQVQKALGCLGFRAQDSDCVWSRDGMEIDLHPDLLGSSVTGRRYSPFQFAPELILKESHPLPNGRDSLQILGSELHLLHAAVHALRHDYRRWLWLLDIGMLLRRSNVARLLELARRTNTRRPLAYALFALEALFHDEVAARRAPDLPAISLPETAYLASALGRPTRVHLGEAIAALGHVDRSRQVLCWLELLVSSQGRRRAFGRARPWSRWRVTAGTVIRGLADGCELLRYLAKERSRAIRQS